MFLKKIEIKLNEIPPSKKNSKRIIYRKGKRPFLLSSENYINWEKETIIKLKNIKILKKIKEPIKNCNIDIFFNPDNKRKWDLTNKSEGILDALVLSGIIEDDNYSVINKLCLFIDTSINSYVQIIIYF